MLNDSLLSVRGEMSSAIRAARSAGVNTVVQLEAKAAGAMKYTGKALGTLFIGLQLIDTFNTFIEMGKITELQNKIAFLLGGSDPMIGYLDQKKDEMLGNTALSWLLFGITFALNPVAGLAVMGGAAAVQGVVGIATADSRQREENKNNTDMMMRLQNLYGADPDAVWNSANSHGVSDDINRNLDSVDYKKNLLIMEKYRAFLPQLKAQVEKFKAAPRSVHSLGWTSTDVMLQAQMQHFASFIEDIPDPSTYESNMRDLGRRTIYLHDNMLTLKKLGARAFWTPQRIRQYLRPEMYQMADELGWLDNTPIEIMSSIEALAIRYQNRQIAHDNASKHNNSEMQPLIVDRSPNRPRVKEWDHLMHYLDLQQEVEGMLEKDLHQPEKYYV